jgi:hypothetical protein
MRRILILLLSCLPVIALAAPPKPFSAEYEVMRNGSRIGTGTISLAALPDGQWALETRSGARGGLAGAAGVRREERSLLRWTGTQFATVEYTMQQRAAWSTRNLSITIDSNARTASSTNRRETRQLPYRPGMLDRHALTAAIMVDLGAGKDGVLEYLVAERTDVETQRYDVAASVKLETALGVKRPRHQDLVRPRTRLDPAAHQAVRSRRRNHRHAHHRHPLTPGVRAGGGSSRPACPASLRCSRSRGRCGRCGPPRFRRAPPGRPAPATPRRAGRWP